MASDRVHALLEEAMQVHRADPTQAIAQLRVAVALHENDGIGSYEQYAHALRLLALTLHEIGEVEDAARTLERIPECDDPGMRCTVALTRGWLAYLSGELEQALLQTQLSLQTAQKLDLHTETRNWGLINLGVIYTALNAPELGMARFIEARQEAQKGAGNPRMEGGALINIAEIHLTYQDYEAALEAVLSCLPLVEAASDPYLTITVHADLIQAYIGLERQEDAWAASVHMETLPRPLPICEVLFWRNRAMLLRLRGEYDAARRALRTAASNARKGRLVEVEVSVARELARTLAHTDGAIALRVARAALGRAAVLRLQNEEAALHELIAELAEAQGHWKLALTHLRRWQALQKEFLVRSAQHQRILFSVELSLESARREAEEERRRSARLEEEASRDGMTGLYNHATFQRRLAERLARQEPTALVLLDVDDFKRFNDTHGHVAGDALLQELARLFPEIIRDGDLLARYGGEEFALLASGDLALAAELGERLRSTIAAHAFSRGGVTISVGVAASPSCPPNPGALVDAADRALYRAKRSGKNRVCRSDTGKL